MTNRKDHTETCWEQVMSMATPIMTCEGCSAYFEKRKRAYLKWLAEQEAPRTTSTKIKLEQQNV